MPSEKLTLVERTKILKNAKVNNKDNAKEAAKVLNNFFSTIIQDLKKFHNIKSNIRYLLPSVIQL